MPRREAVGLTLLAAVAVVTAAWWSLALWPLSSDAPAWLARTRWVCFGAAADGLPNAGGWIALIGEPIAMTLLLLVVWGDAVRGGLQVLRASPRGRLALGATVVVALAGLGAAAARVAVAADTGFDTFALTAADATRIDRDAPPLALIDQSGQPFTLAATRGQPVLVTFAFGHCETVCPLVVHDVLTAAARAAVTPHIVIVTVDPWRDLPSRLPAVARSWELPPDARVLSGTVAAVTATLEAWGVGITRDERTGDVVHPAIVYLLDRHGRIAFTAPGGVDVLVGLLNQL